MQPKDILTFIGNDFWFTLAVFNTWAMLLFKETPAIGFDVQIHQVAHEFLPN
jgi:hypothetical protein